MSGQIVQRIFMPLVMPAVITTAVILGILGTIGVQDFGKLLVDKNPFAIGIVSVVTCAILFLFYKLGILLNES